MMYKIVLPLVACVATGSYCSLYGKEVAERESAKTALKAVIGDVPGEIAPAQQKPSAVPQDEQMDFAEFIALKAAEAIEKQKLSFDFEFVLEPGKEMSQEEWAKYVEKAAACLLKNRLDESQGPYDALARVAAIFGELADHRLHGRVEASSSIEGQADLTP